MAEVKETCGCGASFEGYPGAARSFREAHQPCRERRDLPSVKALAQIIRNVDGAHTLGAAALAEAIIAAAEVPRG